MKHPSGLLLAGLLAALACGGNDAIEDSLGPEETARLDRAAEGLVGVSERVRGEVLRVCDKWGHLDRPCVNNEIRFDQLDCWLEQGEKRWRHAQKRKMGVWSADTMTMQVQNNCVEKRRWYKLEEGSRF